MSSILLLIRDIIKFLYCFAIRLRARFMVVRRGKNSISLKARIDSVPKGSKLYLSEGCFIEDYAVVNTFHGDVALGCNSNLGIGNIIIGPVKIGNNVRFGQYCFLTGENRVRESDGTIVDSSVSVDCKQVVIGNNVWLGTGVKVLPGVEIGDNCVIAAGSVVTKSITSNTMAAGVPAKIIKKF